jgi:hypothetical protein
VLDAEAVEDVDGAVIHQGGNRHQELSLRAPQETPQAVREAEQLRGRIELS